jgi:hypothetical protein
MDSYYQKAKRSNQRHLRGIREHHNRRHSPERPASTKPDGNDYVRRWLSQTQRKPDWESHVQSKHTHQPRDDLSSWRPHNLGAVDLERLARPTGGRKRRGRSPDSSIIPINPKRRDATGPTEQVSGTRDGGHHHYDEPNQWPEFHSQSPLPSTEEGGNAKFERRARHKTRPDRYNTNKEKQPRLKKESNVAEEKAKRTKDVSSKKRKLSSGRDVMKTYDSDALLTKDRLTVGLSLALNLFNANRSYQVPTHMTPGIFANARVAQPDHGRYASRFARLTLTPS